MALITSPTETIPDLNYEYHTVTIDSIGQSSSNSFTVYLNQPIKNVVQARLVATHLHTEDTTEHYYISIEELDSNFNTRASNVYGGQSALSKVNGCFASLVSTAIDHGNSEHIQLFRDEYPIVTQYIDPIRQLSRLTIKIFDQDGNLLTPNGDDDPNHLIIRFVCRKPNL